jgi:hypothetical protein
LFSLISVLGLAVTWLWLKAQMWNIMFLGPGFPSPTQKENRVFQQLSFWTAAISLRAIAQKLQWLHSFPRGFGGPECFPQGVSLGVVLLDHIAGPFLFFAEPPYCFP